MQASRGKPALFPLLETGLMVSTVAAASQFLAARGQSGPAQHNDNSEAGSSGAKAFRKIIVELLLRGSEALLKI